VFEQEKDIIAHIDLPGVPREDITIDTNDVDEVTIHGDARRPDEFQAASSRVRERQIGKFRKILRLPPGCQLEQTRAIYRDGLLEVRIPKGENFRQVQIQ
jgi:HSP20 family protein